MKIKHYLLLTSAVCALTTSAQDGKKAKKSAKNLPLTRQQWI